MVVDVKLLDTATMTGGKTAVVTFLHEHAAMAYEAFVQDHPLDFDGAVAHVTVINTPTWPIPMNLRNNIHDFGHTRCLEVHNFPRNVLPSALKQEMAFCPVLKYDGLESMSMSGDGILGLRFSSVKFATQASAMFGFKPRYRKCAVRFALDPCAQPLETLLEVPKSVQNAVNEACTVPADNVDADLSSVEEGKGSKVDNGAVNEVSLPAFDNSDPGLAAMDEKTGRLTKVEWESEPETSHGRGAEVEQ
jgi:hypothetical protein